MTQRSYQFSVVSNRSTQGQSTIVSTTNQNNACVLENVQGARHQLQVIDNGDGRFDVNDHYFMRDQGTITPLTSEDGLKVLNYFANPEVLKERQESLQISQSTRVDNPIGHQRELDLARAFTDTELRAINRNPAVWFMDGHIEADLITGARRFTDAENGQWRARPTVNFLGVSLPNIFSPSWHMTAGGFHLFDGPHGWRPSDWGFGLTDVLRKAIVIGSLFAGVGAIFGGVEGAIAGEVLAWLVFTGNYTASEIAVIGYRGRNDAAIHQLSAASTSSQTPVLASNADNIRRNMEVVERRTTAAVRDRFFGFSRPIIFSLIAFAPDPNSNPWFRSLNILKASNRANFFGTHSIIGGFGRLFKSVGSNLFRGAGPANAVVGLAIGGAALYGMYELSRAWYRVYTSAYAPLRYESLENKCTSAFFSVLNTSVLLSVASKQLTAITGSSALTAGNMFRAARLLRGQRVNFQIAQLLPTFIHGIKEFPLMKNAVLPLINNLFVRPLRFLIWNPVRALIWNPAKTWIWKPLSHLIVTRAPSVVRVAENLVIRSHPYRTAVVATEEVATKIPRVGILIALGVAVAGGITMFAAREAGLLDDDEISRYLPSGE